VVKTMSDELKKEEGWKGQAVDPICLALALADEFDQARRCDWNSRKKLCEYHDQPNFRATEIPEFASLGYQCWGTLRELALLHTLRPCKECGNDTLYKHGYGIGCCSCLGDQDDCEDCNNGGCTCYAENGNLPDAITRWNLCYGDSGERGRVQVVG
jgi:hypothetical protein